MTRPNPLADELSPEAKAELAAVFADMKRDRPKVIRRGPRSPWELGRPGW